MGGDVALRRCCEDEGTDWSHGAMTTRSRYGLREVRVGDASIPDAPKFLHRCAADPRSRSMLRIEATVASTQDDEENVPLISVLS